MGAFDGYTGGDWEDFTSDSWMASGDPMHMLAGGSMHLANEAGYSPSSLYDEYFDPDNIDWPEGVLPNISPEAEGGVQELLALLEHGSNASRDTAKRLKMAGYSGAAAAAGEARVQNSTFKDRINNVSSLQYSLSSFESRLNSLLDSADVQTKGEAALSSIFV